MSVISEKYNNFPLDEIFQQNREIQERETKTTKIRLKLLPILDELHLEEHLTEAALFLRGHTEKFEMPFESGNFGKKQQYLDICFTIIFNETGEGRNYSYDHFSVSIRANDKDNHFEITTNSAVVPGTSSHESRTYIDATEDTLTDVIVKAMRNPLHQMSEIELSDLAASYNLASW